MIMAAHLRGLGQSCGTLANPCQGQLPFTQVTITPAQLAQLAAMAPPAQPQPSQISYSLPPGLETATAASTQTGASAAAGVSSITPLLLGGLALLAAFLLGVFK